MQSHHHVPRAARRRGFVGRVIRFLLRVSARAIGAVLLFIVLGTLAVYLTARGMLDNEHIKAMLVDQLQEALHRPVQVEGVVLTPRGVKLKNLRIIERRDVPGQALLDSDFVLITVKPLPLLRGAVRLKSVVLVSPRISIVRSEFGEWSVSDIFSSTSPATMKWGPFLLGSLAADRTRIENGLMRIDDRLRGTKHVIEKFCLTLDDFSLRQPFDYDLSFDNVNTVQGRDIATSWEARGMGNLASLEPARAQVVAPKFSVTVNGLRMEGSAGLKGLRDPELDLSLKVPEVTRAWWLRYAEKAPDLALPPSVWKLKLQYDRSARRINIPHLQVKAGPLSASGGLIVNFSSGSAVPAGPFMTADLALDEFPLAQASKFTGFFSPYRLEGRVQGRVGLSWRPGSFALHRGNVQWRGAKGLAWGHAFTGDIDLSAADELRRVEAAVKGGSLETSAGRLSDIAMSAAVVQKDLKISRLRFRWDGSNVDLKARIRNYSKPREIVVSGKLDRLEWGSLQAFFQPVQTSTAAPGPKGKTPWVKSLKYAIPDAFPDTAGRVEIGDIVHDNFKTSNFVILWELRGVTPTLKQVRGGAKMSFGPGRFADIPALQDSSKVMRVVLSPFTFMHRLNNLSVMSAGTMVPKTLDFSLIEGEYEFDRGVVTTRYFSADSPQMVAFSDGKMDFDKETVQMNILTRLTKDRAGQLPEFYVDQEGRPSLAFTVKGNLNSPDVDFRKMAPGEIEKSKDQVKERSKKIFMGEEKVNAL